MAYVASGMIIIRLCVAVSGCFIPKENKFFSRLGLILFYWKHFVKGRSHRRFLLRQLDAIFVSLKLQLQNRTCKPGAIFSAICRRDIAEVSDMFETCCNLSATKIASSCRDKNRLSCVRALTKPRHKGHVGPLTKTTLTMNKLEKTRNNRRSLSGFNTSITLK